MVTCEVEAGGETGFGYGYADRRYRPLRHRRPRPGPVGAGRRSTRPACWRAMVDAVRNHGRQGVAAMAISAADAALHDLRGKLLDAPLSALLGPCREAVPAYGSGGFLTYSQEEMHAQIDGWREAGMTVDEDQGQR